MIQANDFIDALYAKGIRLFTGVPDSYLKSLSTALLRRGDGIRHVIAANEGNCMGLALGHFLASGAPAVVYMQNSGLGNAVNPVTSLLARDVYSVPALLVVGWRGEPGGKDEPQHALQGKITPGMLNLMGIPYRILDAESDAQVTVDSLYAAMMESSAPVALLVRKGAFAPEAAEPKSADAGRLLREEALEVILDVLPEDCSCFATTGKTGRELFELRQKRGEPQKDFLTVGGMGHASSIAIGAALASGSKLMVCLDGDGAALMHMGALAQSGALAPANFVHIIFNNRCHESVGGQPTCAPDLTFTRIGETCGYASCRRAVSIEEITGALQAAVRCPGPHLVEVMLKPGSRSDLGRPTSSPINNKLNVMRHLQKHVLDPL